MTGLVLDLASYDRPVDIITAAGAATGPAAVDDRSA